MTRTFSYAKSFNGDLSSWNVSQVQDMQGMFASASSFNGNWDLSSWDVRQVQDMTEMFKYASSFNGDLSSWDISQVQSMDHMFQDASSFNQDLCEWADKNFPYDQALDIFADSGCTYQSTPRIEQGGPFCASTCIQDDKNPGIDKNQVTAVPTETEMSMTKAPVAAPIVSEMLIEDFATAAPTAMSMRVNCGFCMGNQIFDLATELPPPMNSCGGLMDYVMANPIPTDDTEGCAALKAAEELCCPAPPTASPVATTTT